MSHSLRDLREEKIGSDFWEYSATIWNEGKRCVIVVPLRILIDIENQGKRKYEFKVTLTPIREAKPTPDKKTDEEEVKEVQ